MATPVSPAAEPPALATPDRPSRPLSTWALLKAIPTNSLGVLDDQLFEELVVFRRYGLGGMQPACFVSDPAGVKQVLVDKFDNYPRVPTIRRLFEAEIGTGTLASEGETWRRHRRVATPSIDHRAVRGDTPAVIALAESGADRLARHYAGKKSVDIERFAQDLLARMLNQVATGGDERAMPVLKWLSTVPRKPRGVDIVPKPEWVSKLLVRRRLEGSKAEADAQLRALIAERLQPDYAGGQDLLWRLAHAEDRQTGVPFTAEEARDEAASIIAAGDATIRALTWIWYLLDLHRDVEARFHAELDEVVGTRPLVAEDFQKLPYVRQVLDEVMRLYPPIPVIVRKARAADVICGVKIPRGTIVTVAPFVIHRHRRLWSDPDRFDPERFAEGARGGRPRYAFIPFAAGPGVCPGATVAMTNLMASIVTLGRRFRFRLATTVPIVPFGGISLQPKGGLKVTVEVR
jgi:cytochrome P450